MEHFKFINGCSIALSNRFNFRSLKHSVNPNKALVGWNRTFINSPFVLLESVVHLSVQLDHFLILYFTKSRIWNDFAICSRSNMQYILILYVLHSRRVNNNNKLTTFICTALQILQVSVTGQILHREESFHELLFLSFSQQCRLWLFLGCWVCSYQYGRRSVWREFLWYSPRNQGSVTEHESEAKRTHHQQHFDGRNCGYTFYGHLFCVKICCWGLEWILGSTPTAVWHQVKRHDKRNFHDGRLSLRYSRQIRRLQSSESIYMEIIKNFINEL